MFEQHHAYVWNTLRRLGVRRADLPDVTHDVFLVVHRKLAEFDPERAIKPWLFGIAYRVCADHRRLARHREIPTAEMDEDPIEGETERELEQRERRALLLRALQTIDPDRRAVLVMHDLDELEMSEIADVLGIPANTGYSRLRVARQELAGALRRLTEGRGGRARG